MDIPKSVIDNLKTALGLTKTEIVPENVLVAYKEYKKMNDILCAGSVTPKELVLLCMVCGVCHKTAQEVEKATKEQAESEARPPLAEELTEEEEIKQAFV